VNILIVLYMIYVRWESLRGREQLNASRLQQT
jgi:hypothetical protein